ncbi:hypothetical protein ABK040_006781 [Willaertia magna]
MKKINILSLIKRNCVVRDYSSKIISDRASALEETIWSTYTPLAIANNAVNLSQGFPDWTPDTFVIEALQKQLSQPVHQYAKAHGDPILVESLQRLYNNKEISGIEYGKYSPNEILITNGASDALFIAIQSIVNPGDEVIIIEPFYDAYKSVVEMSGAKPIFIPLRQINNEENSSDSWKLDLNELESKITSKTKAIIINTPHNPTGKVFTKKELEELSKVILKHDNLFVISDEVYEFLTFEQHVCNRIVNVEGMFERTLLIGSAGKTFSNTGWKVGWILGPKEIIDACYLVNQYIKFCISTPMQRAVADCIHYAIDNNYFNIIRNRLIDRRNLLMSMLKDTGLSPIQPAGGYFIMVNVSNVKFPFNPNSKDTKDVQFCKWLPVEAKIAAIPPSAFYSEENKHLVKDYARFCFCKKEETLLAAKEKFEILKKKFVQ